LLLRLLLVGRPIRLILTLGGPVRLMLTLGSLVRLILTLRCLVWLLILALGCLISRGLISIRLIAMGLLTQESH